MLGSSRTERKNSEGTSPSTSVNVLYRSKNFMQRESSMVSGFKPPRKKMRGNHPGHSKGNKSTQKSTNVEIKVGLL